MTFGYPLAVGRRNLSPFQVDQPIEPPKPPARLIESPVWTHFETPSSALLIPNPLYTMLSEIKSASTRLDTLEKPTERQAA